MLRGRALLAGLALVAAAGSAQAQLGGMFGGLVSGMRGGSDVFSLVDRFNADSAAISRAMAYALIQIKAALGTKEEAAQARQQAEDLSKATDAKEAGALQGTIIKTDLARVGELTKSEEARARLERLSPEIQKKVGQSILAVGVSALRLPLLLDSGRRVVEGSLYNPMMLLQPTVIPKLLSAKEGVELLADAAPKIGPIVTTGFALMREVNINPGNPSRDSELKVDTEIAFPD